MILIVNGKTGRDSIFLEHLHWCRARYIFHSLGQCSNSVLKIMLFRSRNINIQPPLTAQICALHTDGDKHISLKGRSENADSVDYTKSFILNYLESRGFNNHLEGIRLFKWVSSHKVFRITTDPVNRQIALSFSIPFSSPVLWYMHQNVGLAHGQLPTIFSVDQSDIKPAEVDFYDHL